MPVRHLSSIYTCPKCGWTKKVTPRSDALLPGEYFSECPSCGCGTLTHRNVSARNPLVDQLTAMLERFSSKANK